MATIVPAGAAALLLLLTGACDSQALVRAAPSQAAAKASGPAHGAVTGVAAVCAGPASGTRNFRLKVYASRGKKTVARQWVDAGSRNAGGRYSFLLSPGEYLISAPASGDPPAVITVHADGVTTVNFPQHCG